MNDFDETLSDDRIAPHRGFNAKARNMLIGHDDMNLPDSMQILRGMPQNKSSSDFDLRKKLKSSFKKGSNNTSPKSQSSTQSISEQPVFDTIGEQAVVKRHLKLSEIGKARSCAELKSDKRLLRTFQEENILKMPSIDSDIGTAAPSDVDDLCLTFEGIGKSMIYAAQNGNKNNKNEKTNK